MLTIFAFILTLLGCINWLMIGLLQYDFIAGIFGFQASIFSRLIYIVIGASSVFLVFKLIKNKGSLPIWTARNKKNLAKHINKIGNKDKSPSFSANTEAGEALNLSQFDEKQDKPDSEIQQHQGLFDEHFNGRQ